MTNGITYDPATQRWLMQCGSTAVPIRHLDSGSKPIPAPASSSSTRSRANINHTEEDHDHLRTP